MGRSVCGSRRIAGGLSRGLIEQGAAGRTSEDDQSAAIVTGCLSGESPGLTLGQALSTLRSD